jgi:FkbM family methyltransferase
VSSAAAAHRPVSDVATVLADPAAFLARERERSPGIAHHRLLSGGVACIRHRTEDVEVFDEIFFRREHAVPPEFARPLLALGRPLRIADVGANIGLFALFARWTLPVERIHLIEPDPENLEVLDEFVRINADGCGFRITRACAANYTGEIAFVAGRFSMSHVAARVELHEARKVPCVDLFTVLDDVDLVKLDVEGGEWPILADARLAELPAHTLVVELHARDCPELHPLALGERLLRKAGYATRCASERPTGRAIVWANRA